MKRIINIMLTIAVAAMATHTFDTCAASRTQRKQQRQELIRKRLAQQKGISPTQVKAPAGRRGIQKRGRRTPAIQTKSPEIQKQDKQMNQNLQQKTEALNKAIEQKEKATTPTEKAITEKNVNALAQELIDSINNKRSWDGDIYSGYEKTQKDKAKLAITKLTPMKKNVEKMLARKQADLDKVTSKGFFWNAAIKGKETEYNNLLAEVNKLKETLVRIDTALNDQKVIAGQEWANAYYALLGVGALGTAATAANVALYGSTGIVGSTAIAAKDKIGAGLGSTYSWLQEKGSGTWEWGKWVKEYGFTTASTLFALYNAYRQASALASVAKVAYEKAVGQEEKKNPNATPEQRAAALAKEKAELDKQMKAFENAEAEYKAGLAQAQAQKGKK